MSHKVITHEQFQCSEVVGDDCELDRHHVIVASKSLNTDLSEELSLAWMITIRFGSPLESGCGRWVVHMNIYSYLEMFQTPSHPLQNPSLCNSSKFAGQIFGVVTVYLRFTGDHQLW